MNYYVHNSVAGSTTVLEGIYAHQNLYLEQTHSLFLDMAEAGGIPLAIVFFAVVLMHLFRSSGSGVIIAGLAGLTVNSILESTSFWLPTYPHFWVLLGFAGALHASLKPQGPSRFFRPILVCLLLFGSVLTILEDHFLLSGWFYHCIGNEAKAMKNGETAGTIAPFDTGPMELLTEVNLAQKNGPAAEGILDILIRRKKDFAPYYGQLGKIDLFQKDYANADKNLSLARKFQQATT